MTRFRAKKFDITFALGVTPREMVRAVQQAGSYKAKLAGAAQYSVRDKDLTLIAMTDKESYKAGASGKLRLKVKAKKGAKVTGVTVEAPEAVKVSETDQKVRDKKVVTYRFKVEKASAKVGYLELTVSSEGEAGQSTYTLKVPVLVNN